MTLKTVLVVGPALFASLYLPVSALHDEAASSAPSGVHRRDSANTQTEVPVARAQSTSGSIAGLHSGTDPDRPVRLIVKLRSVGVPGVHAMTAPATEIAKGVKPPQVPDALSVIIDQHAVRSVSPLFPAHARGTTGQSRSSAERAAALRERFPERAARAEPGAVAPDLSRIYVLELGARPASDVKAVLDSLKADPNVAYAEEDGIVHTCYVPNDPRYADDLPGLKAIGTTQAWDTTQGAGIVVAVIDTGVDYEHPDIKDNIWLNDGEIAGNSLDDDGNGFVDDVMGWDFAGPSSWFPIEDADPDDRDGHGTHVAGTIAATGNNEIGVIGVAWKSEIMIVRGLDDFGTGSDSSLARSITYAVDNGADVINASWGGEGPSQAIADAVEYAHAHGVVFVAAAGNDTRNASQFHPAHTPAAITVAALDHSGEPTSFTNFGSRIDVAAPGQDILSLEAGTGGYTEKSGTSMAAPHVSGLAALILASHPTYTVEQVRQVMRTTATDLGTPGKDPAFGYGRVNAAAAVRATGNVLESRILTPYESTPIAGPITVSGSARGVGFARYVLDFGAGAAPQTWTSLVESTNAVSNGALGVLDPSALPDGLYTIRLRTYSTLGTMFSDQIEIVVRYVEITWPAPPSVRSLTQPMKPGCTYQIAGSAQGGSFRSFVMEWAPGIDATTGWSTTGFVLTGDGQTTVVGDTLASWTPPGALEGYHTIRLTVNNSSFSNTTTTVVYLEPALASSIWPLHLGDIPSNEGPALVTGADGEKRFAFGARGSPMAFRAIAYDGSQETLATIYPSNFQPAAADMDGSPGDEVVVPNGPCLSICTPHLEQIRTISAPAGRSFVLDPIALPDLDNDGDPEIITASRSDSALDAGGGLLHIYRSDGTPYLNFEAQPFPTATFCHAQVVVVDLDGDGCKEIVMAAGGMNLPDYTLECFNTDGSARAGWQRITVSNTQLTLLSAADLDGDGTSELVIVEHDTETESDQIRVLDGDGVIRPGWPVRVESAPAHAVKVSIGDVDRDGIPEIVAAGKTGLRILNADGSLWGPEWSHANASPVTTVSGPLIADVDGDGIPEILAATSTLNTDDPSANYFEVRLTCYRSDGSVMRTCPVFGTAGQQPYMPTILAGEFNGDGMTDIVVTYALLSGGSYKGLPFDAAMTCLTFDTPFNADASSWVSNHHDSQNSRTANTAPTFTTRPQSQSVGAGTSVILTARATGSPIPRFQWQKDGVAIPGATSATLALRCPQARDAGRYTVIISSPAGTISSEATLTVSDETAADSRALNLSTRAYMRDGANQPLIPGFVIDGTGTKRLLIRAVGPGMSELGIQDLVADTRLVLKRYDPAAKAFVDIAGNDDWTSDPALQDVTSAVGAFPLLPGSRDAALLVDAGPGHYTVFADALGTQPTGIAMVEVYDADASSGSAKLINVSNRGYVGVGSGIMIPGFVIANEGPKKLLIRAVGPGLAEHGVSDHLADPRLLLYRAVDETEHSDLILTNDDWSDDPDAAITAAVAEEVGAFALAPGSKDAAFVATLQPGVYTIHALGVDDATGEALVELYIVR